MDGFLIGTFPDDDNRYHASFQMDGPNSSKISRLRCLNLHDLENPDFLSVDMLMAQPLVGISPPVHEELIPSQLLQIRWLSVILNQI